jgi:hypothetical protein
MHKILYTYIYIVICIDVIIVFLNYTQKFYLIVYSGCFEPDFNNGVQIIF